MIELIQFPWSPYCIVQKQILEYSGTPLKITNIPNQDRSLVWKLTKHRYYGVPIIRDGRFVVFELSDDSQVIAKYLDQKLQLGLFPFSLEGVQSLLWRAIENDIEGVTFRLNDIYWKENVPAPEHLDFFRFKERKFGRGCIEQWQAHQGDLLKQLEQKLLPFEEMLAHNPFLLGEEPRFVDFDLFGMLENYLYSGHYELPAAHPHVKEWHQRLAGLKIQRTK
jgi:glutathione S-transferase